MLECAPGKYLTVIGSHITMLISDWYTGYSAEDGECVLQCEEGTVERGGQCQPVCDADTCSGHGTCHVSGHGFMCQCEENYSGDRCECGPGYRYHGDTCLDIDECYELEPCSQVCNNTQVGGTRQCAPRHVTQ